LPPIEVSLLWHRRHERDRRSAGCARPSPRRRARSAPARDGRGARSRRPRAATAEPVA
jgi:hypothetical protein